MNGAMAAWLPEGRRLHLNHGPIDLVVEASGAAQQLELAYAAATVRFSTILEELVAELPELRGPALPKRRRFAGPTAQRMERAVRPHAETFITPMAAVAGAVADEVLAAMTGAASLERAYVNNGGDIALQLAEGQSLRLAIAGTMHGLADRIEIDARSPVRGVATSGWRGRSFSLGIADAVTVLGRDGAGADAAATLIANAVDLPGHPAIVRLPARTIAPDSDLGERAVTQAVGRLTEAEVADALERGLAAAWAMREKGTIVGAALFLAGSTRVCGGAVASCPSPEFSRGENGRVATDGALCLPR